jgi:hypothetical protein
MKDAVKKVIAAITVGKDMNAVSRWRRKGEMAMGRECG